jgi:hypothetical protein
MIPRSYIVTPTRAVRRWTLTHFIATGYATEWSRSGLECRSLDDGGGVRKAAHCPMSYDSLSTVSSLDSQTNSVVRMTLLGVFA